MSMHPTVVSYPGLVISQTPLVAPSTVHRSWQGWLWVSPHMMSTQPWGEQLVVLLLGPS